MRLLLAMLAATLACGADRRALPVPSVVPSQAPASPARPAPGSIWQPGAVLGDVARDLRASQTDDILTILVVERASAVATGTTKTSRQSSAEYSAGALFGRTRIPGPLSNMASLGGDQQLSGEGATSRSTTLSTTLAARVIEVMPNGNLLLEAAKTVTVNSETQVVTVRGLARPADIAPGNVIRSDRLAQMEVRVNGKGVVGDAVRRPHFLYRLLLGLLPF